MLGLAVVAFAHREVIGFAFANVPGLFGLGVFGALEERRLGLLGRRLAQEGKLAEAIAAWEASLAIDPRGEYRRDLAVAVLQNGDPVRAERELRLHVESFPRDGLALLSLALLSESRGATRVEVLAALDEAEAAVEAELADLKSPAKPFPGPEARKHERQLAELQELRAEIERELIRRRP